jgi:hypothetical protein
LSSVIKVDKIQSDTGTVNVASKIEFPAGTVSAPSIFPTGDTNTGIFFPAADTIAFTEGGVEAMRINSSGSVGIGTTNALPGTLMDVRQGVTVRVDAAGTNPYFQFYNANAGSNLKTWRFGADSAGALAIETINDAYSAATERMRVTNGGSVLIGTVTNRGRITVEGGSIVPAGTPSANWGLDFAPSTASPTCITLANDATYDLATGSGLVMLVTTDGSASGVAFTSFGNVGVLVAIGAGTVTTVINNAGTLNLYYNAGTAKYRIQNKLGSSKNIFVTTIRGRDST